MWPFPDLSGPEIGRLANKAWQFLLTEPSGSTPFVSVVLVPFAAVLCLAAAHLGRIDRYRFRRVFGAMVSTRYLTHRSHVFDIVMMFGNIGLFAMMCAQATVSIAAVAALGNRTLDSLLGPLIDPVALAYVGTWWTIGLFLAYEFAYWLDHYLSHRIPVLWEFHKVHHAAEVLTPLTNFRVHPIDSIVFINIVAVVLGMTKALLTRFAGAAPISVDTWGGMIVIGIAISIFAQFQHTNVWLPVTGFLGRLILSPAHHQIHHSVDVRHHDKNMGNMLALFDWLFGTLYVPEKKRQKLVFGVDTMPNPRHDLHEGLVQPFLDAARHLTPGQSDVTAVARANVDRAPSAMKN